MRIHTKAGPTLSLWLDKLCDLGDVLSQIRACVTVRTVKNDRELCYTCPRDYGNFSPAKASGTSLSCCVNLCLLC